MQKAGDKNEYDFIESFVQNLEDKWILKKEEKSNHQLTPRRKDVSKLFFKTIIFLQAAELKRLIPEEDFQSEIEMQINKYLNKIK